MRRVLRSVSGRALGCLLALLVLPQLAWGQTAAGDRRWTLEVYAGGGLPSVSTAGAPLTTFPDGQPFTAASGFPSRRQSSWLFGDGAKMLNDALTDFGRITGASFTRIVPLDAALTSNALTGSNGAVFGVRVGRSLSRRLAVEVGVERSQTPLAFSSAFRSALDQSTESFEAAFGDLLASAPVTNAAAGTTLTISETSGSETRLTAGLIVTLAQSGRVSVYATAGGGVAMTGGDGPQAILNGTYSFRYFGSVPMAERDRVLITVDRPSTAAVASLGGGITYDVTPTAGIRADVRLALRANKASLVVNANPDITAQPTADVMSSLTTPALQFSTTTGVPSSLSGEPVRLTTFAGSGRNRHVSVTIGLFKRF